MTPQELKNSILQLAIQGKLVEQRPEEGTAEELFARIQEEKQRLIAEKKIKINKRIESISDDVIPFDIPESWIWVRFGNLVNYTMGKTPPRAEPEWWGTDIPWVSIADMPESGHICETKESVTSAALDTKFGNKISPAGTLLMSFKLTVGRVSILDIDAVHNEAIISIFPFVDDDSTEKMYLFYVLPFVSQFGESKNAIKGKTLNDTSISNLLIPLPPLAEQKRIVAKIEELLLYIDRYELAWSKLEQFNSRFPEDMKKSLLQYAIQGKLVEQRPEEGTAEELFTQIQQEKQRLISEKKIKKEKSLPEITEDEKTFDIPENWKWIRLGSILHYIDTGKSFKCDEIPPTGNKCGIIKVSAVTWGKFNENESKTCYSNESWVDAYEIHKNDFLICRANTAALVGGCVIVDKISKRLMLSDKVLRLHFTKMIYPFYVLWALRTPFVRNQFGSMSTGTSESMKNISQDILKNTVIPLPPIPEQRRIVEKLEQLLPLCERLKGF